MDEYETPIDHLRPMQASDKNIDPASVVDYNEILSTIAKKPQMNMNEEHERQQPPLEQMQNYNRQNDDMLQQMQSQQYFQQQQQLQAQTQAQAQANLNKHTEVFSSRDKKDLMYIVVAISLAFGDETQKLISKIVPSIYKDGKLSFIGLVLHSIAIGLGLHLSRRIKLE